MNIFIFKIIFVIIVVSGLFSQCIQNGLADYNEDNLLDILDIVELVEQVMNQIQDIENSDINSDGIVDVIDIIELVLKILNPYPNATEILSLDYSSDNIISINWDYVSNPSFQKYEILMSFQIDNQEIIEVVGNQNILEIQISDMVFYQSAWFWVNIVDHWDCGALSEPYALQNIEKEYELDDSGHIVFTEFSVHDFPDPENCAECHPGHVQDWQYSSHAKSMHSPLFFSMWNQEQSNHPDVGERFCVQCHNPISFLSGVDLSGNQNLEMLQNSDLPDQVKHGISCSVCHTYTALSPSYFASDDLNASAEYHMYPGENVYFGPIENPEPNDYHDSQYNSMYLRSEMCLPCHDMTIRGIEAEITFTEWNRIPGFAMSGGTPCQECHMPVKPDGTHDHRFIGVDVDLTYPLGESPYYQGVQDLLSTAATLSFGADEYELPDSIESGESLIIPITVESLTAHNLPSGTAFNREAWIEIIVSQNSNIIYSSGLISSNIEELDRLDSSLLLFTSYLLDENGDTTYTSSDTHGMINETLPALGFRYHLYDLNVPDNISGVLDINVSFKFRPFRPMVIQSHIPNLLSNLPVFEIASIHRQIEVLE